jgi:hypothetical protein
MTSIHADRASNALAGALHLTLYLCLCNLCAKDIIESWTHNGLKWLTIYAARNSIQMAVKQSVVNTPKGTVT